MRRHLIESYCKEHLKIKQSVHDFTELKNKVIIFFAYDEQFVYQDSIEVSLLELISFVFSKPSF